MNTLNRTEVGIIKVLFLTFVLMFLVSGSINVWTNIIHDHRITLLEKKKCGQANRVEKSQKKVTFFS